MWSFAVKRTFDTVEKDKQEQGTHTLPQSERAALMSQNALCGRGIQGYFWQVCNDFD